MITIPDFRLPEFVAKLGAHLPQWPHALNLCVGLNLALKLKMLATDGAELFDGKHFLIAVEDTGGEAHLTYRDGAFHPLWSGSKAGEPDVVFRGTLAAYLKLMTRQEDPDTLFFNRQLSIEGDTELGLAVKNLLDAMEWPPQAWADLKAKVPGLH